jgi:FG-GAP-like repeat
MNERILVACAALTGGTCGSAGAEAPAEVDAGVPWTRHVIDGSSKGADGARLADVNGDGLPDIATGWEQGGAVRVCLHPGPAKAREPWPSVTVGCVTDVEDAIFADLDGDGSTDVVSCAEGDTRAVSVHWAPKNRDRILDPDAWKTEVLPASAGAMRWMFAIPFRIQDQRCLVAGGKDQNAAIGWFEPPADPRDLANWKWHALRPAGWVMSLAASDMDGDSDPDIVFSDRKGKSTGAFWLENPGASGGQWPEHAIGGAGLEAMFLHLADLDRDGLEDVLLAVRPRQIHWLRRQDPGGRVWQPHIIPLPESAGGAKAVSAGDIDGDGKLDLVFSCEGARSPRHGLMWLSCDGAFAAGKWTAHPLSGPDGVKHDLVTLTDLDADGDPDVITTEEVKNLGVIWYENPAKQPTR